MNQTDIRTMVITAAALWAALMQVACVNTDPANTAQTVAGSPPSQEQAVDAVGNTWLPLAKDGLHDMDGLRNPENPAFQLLQEPHEALSGLPANKPRPLLYAFGKAPEPTISTAGNKVDWVLALTTGAISPRRAKTAPGTGVEAEELVMDMDIMLNQNGSMPMVRFPHRAHTMWLVCANCHPAIFVPQKGANKISMYKILEGEQCGICHSAVAFPLTDCSRCHGVQRTSSAIIRQSADTEGQQ